MTSCVQNLLTLFAVILAVVLAIGLMSVLNETYMAVKRFLSQFDLSWILVPAATAALVIFLMRWELPKHVEIVQCGEPQAVSVACK